MDRGVREVRMRGEGRGGYCVDTNGVYGFWKV